jgi:hypothetical protein
MGNVDGTITRMAPRTCGRARHQPGCRSGTAGADAGDAGTFIDRVNATMLKLGTRDRQAGSPGRKITDDTQALNARERIGIDAIKRLRRTP